MNFQKEIMSIIPQLTLDSHKGQAGRIGIVGGSKNYTGAPYFAAISALKVGCDLSHVFCTPEASPVIKTYSPELIVHPILGSPDFTKEITQQLPFLHSLVIGPGLGRDKTTFKSITELLPRAISQDLPIVFDADALFYLNEHHEEIRNYRKAILTPNRVEFSRLLKAVKGIQMDGEADPSTVEMLAGALGGVTIVKKGPVDIISDGRLTTWCEEPGSARRCGGQGDLLSGTLGVFNYWAHRFQNNETQLHSLTVIAAMAACMLTRKCNYLAFQKCKRSTLTTDMIGEISEAFSALFEK